MADLISLTSLKQILEKKDVEHDALLSMIISAHTPIVEQYLNCDLIKTARTRRFNGGRSKYYVNALPMDTTPALLVVTVDTEVQEKDTDFWVDYEAGLIDFGQDTDYSDPLGIEITWTGGYSTITDSDLDDFGVLDVPSDIKLAVMMQCSYVFRRRTELGVSFLSMPNGQKAMSTSIDLLPQVKNILNPYKLRGGSR